MNKELLIFKFNKIHNNYYNYSLLESEILLKSKIKIICPIHGIFEQRAVSHYKHGCSKCANDKLSISKTFCKDEIIKQFKNIHGDKYDYSLVDYKGNKLKVKIICPIHGIFEQRVNDHKSGSNCPQCSNELMIKNKLNYDLINKCKLKYNGKYDYSFVDYKGDKIKVKIICPVHGIFEQTPVCHYNNGCSKCNLEKRRHDNYLNFIKNSNKIHNYKYDYSLVEYKNNKTKVKIICPKHGVFEQRPDQHIQYVGCPICNISTNEQKIINLLEDSKMNYIYQMRFEDCRNKYPLPFDFYLIDYNILIEFDGRHHFEPIDHWGGLDQLEIIKQNDKIKIKYCKDNNIRLIKSTKLTDITDAIKKIKIKT